MIRPSRVHGMNGMRAATTAQAAETKTPPSWTRRPAWKKKRPDCAGVAAAAAAAEGRAGSVQCPRRGVACEPESGSFPERQ
jgi:hypothetical protein